MGLSDLLRHLLIGLPGKATSRKVCRKPSRSLILARRKAQRQARRRQRMFAH